MKRKNPRKGWLADVKRLAIDEMERERDDIEEWRRKASGLYSSILRMKHMALMLQDVEPVSYTAYPELWDQIDALSFALVKMAETAMLENEV